MIECGEEITISYPISTHVERLHSSDLQRRNIVVCSVRDLVSDPLSVAEFLRRPYLLRSRWLVKAYEPRQRQYRQFYLGSSVEFRAPSVLRIGLYEPGTSRPVELFGRGFEATPKDRRLMIRALESWQKFDFGDASLRVFADDLRVCS